MKDFGLDMLSAGRAVLGWWPPGREVSTTRGGRHVKTPHFQEKCKRLMENEYLRWSIPQGRYPPPVPIWYARQS